MDRYNKLAKYIIDRRTNIAYNVAIRHNQDLENVAHMEWFRNAVIEWILEVEETRQQRRE